MANILLVISNVSFVICAVSFIVAVVLWFKFNILSVMNDLSGKTAKRSIAQMRANNEKSGNKSFRPSSVNKERGKLTDTMTSLTQVKETTDGLGQDRPETGLLDTNKQESYSNETTGLLNETESLNDEVKVATVRTSSKKLVMLEDIIFIHTNEVIE